MNPMNVALPSELIESAILRDKEYAWELPSFPIALRRAPSFAYACLGGQFWFLLSDNSLYEPFWLEANASDRAEGEAWSDYAERSCAEVLAKFNTLVSATDFKHEASKFRSLESSFHLMFNAYFVNEQQFSALGPGNIKLWPDEQQR
jgi:hypothetical protein